MEQPLKIGRYDVVSEIGRGAMGVVYDAVDPILERVVAIKTINMALDRGEMESYEKRFTVEARAAGGLNHPNIVTIYDIGRSGELAYMAMEFLEGRELKDVMAAKELTLERALDIAAQVADGLAYAHAHTVVHRDIKPANIMILRDGRVKITDFGIAHMRSAEVRTQTGVVLGSPRYLSPEQVLGKRCDSRADVFALGVVLYEMVTGQPPFAGADVNALMYQIVNADPMAPSAMNATLPPMLDLIVAKALAKQADARYASIAELAADLRTCRQIVMASPGAAETQALSIPGPLSDTASGPVGAEAVDDFVAPLSREATPARGLARAFDSMEATLRLAVTTGAIDRPDDFAATFSLPQAAVDTSLQRFATTPRRDAMRGADAEAPSWSRRDRTVFVCALIGATALGALIVLI